jgi:hypothetical protein
MKIAISLTLALVAAGMFAASDANAHGGHGRSHVTIGYGYGYGYPGYYRPRGFAGGYYGAYYGGYYPRSYLGFSVWPRYRTVRARTADADRIRNQALYVYPAAGQSEQKMADDRYQCHVWSADSTGYDPTLGAGTRAEADNYGRAFTACMEGRDYVVR